MHGLASFTNLLTAGCSALAAYRWYQAAQVDDPPAVLVGSTGYATRTQPGPNTAVNAKPLVKYAQESARRNKKAALWSAVAAALRCIGWALPLLGP
jgi:hypothetical protein